MGIQRINIAIAGRIFPLKIEEDELDTIREIEKNINRKINDYIRQYGNISKLDVVTLVLLDCALDFYKKSNSSGQHEKLINIISGIEESIDKVL